MLAIIIPAVGISNPLQYSFFFFFHSSILAWKVPMTEEPGGLQSLGLQSWTQLSDGAHQLFLLLLWCY